VILHGKESDDTLSGLSSTRTGCVILHGKERADTVASPLHELGV
jgi:hypothetical protein